MVEFHQEALAEQNLEEPLCTVQK